MNFNDFNECAKIVAAEFPTINFTVRQMNSPVESFLGQTVCACSRIISVFEFKQNLLDDFRNDCTILSTNSATSDYFLGFHSIIKKRPNDETITLRYAKGAASITPKE